MPDVPKAPENPLIFIKHCIGEGRILWTYHLNMRLTARGITRSAIVYSVDTYELIESYPDDKYLPSYLVLSRPNADAIHILFATDVAETSVRVVTAYRPDAREWQPDLKKRKVT